MVPRSAKPVFGQLAVKMANNRLWLVDKETGRRILLAKGWGSGWDAWANEGSLDGFFTPPDDVPTDIGGACGGDSTLMLEWEHGNDDD